MQTSSLDPGPPSHALKGRSIVGRLLGRVSELNRVTLRFTDPDVERRFQGDYFRNNLSYMRLALLMGIAVWAAFGLLARVVVTEGRELDLVLRFGLAIPTLMLSLALTYRRWFPRMWQPVFSVVLLVNGLLWVAHRALVEDARPDWGYAGLIVVLAFNYILSRVQLVYSAIIGALLIASFNVVSLVFTDDQPIDLLIANYFLGVFATIGMAGAYSLERLTRLLFLRQRELDRERQRADDLLGNTLPQAIVDRLKGRGTSPDLEYIAEGHPRVTVLFADLVGFTERAGGVSPHDLVVALDDVFTRFDAVAGSLGMEKIKTVGDAYMAVAGAPEERVDHAEAAAEMALEIIDCVKDVRWPTGEPIDVRIGIASGPVVAGVIGRRKFAYDLWGDTVNLASRLESNGLTGRILVSESTHELLEGRYAFGDPWVLELKGKGPTTARILIGRKESRDSGTRSAMAGHPTGSGES